MRNLVLLARRDGWGGAVSAHSVVCQRRQTPLHPPLSMEIAKNEPANNQQDEQGEKRPSEGDSSLQTASVDALERERTVNVAYRA